MNSISTENWVRAGWQGLSFTLPEDWNIGAIGGEKQQGYLRFDDPEMARMEIKWAEAGSGFVDIPGLVDKYLKDLTKGKKNKTEVSRDLKLISKRKLKSKRALECFAWKAERQGFGAAWYCPDCHRTVIIQVMGTLDEPVDLLAEQVILSVEDHPDPEWIYWSTYGFSCETPTDFNLVGQKLMAGLIEITLDRDGEKLHVARWGMGNVLLRNRTLEEWGRKELSKRLKKFDTAYTETDFRGHTDIAIGGRTMLPQEKVNSFLQHCRGKQFADRVSAHLWYCDKSNKIYYVEGILDRDNLDIVEQVRERIDCCGSEE